MHMSYAAINYHIYTHRSLNFFKVRKIVAEYFYWPPWKQKYHQNSILPIKKKKGQPLSAEDKAHNKALAKRRIFIEHINRRCKIFRIVKDVYRGKHKNYSLT